MLFPSSIIGSMPRPQFVRELLAEKDVVSADVYRRKIDDCIRFIVALQEHAGLDVVSDGEWRRVSYLGVIAQLASGFEISEGVEGKPHIITVTGEVVPKEQGFIAQEVTFLKSITSKDIKVCLPSPTLLAERMWRAEQSAGIYPSPHVFAQACVPILRDELQRIVQEGASIIQIDDPHFCLFVDPSVRNAYDDWEGEAEFAVDLTNTLVDGINAKIAVHLCRRAGARSRGDLLYTGGFECILPFLNRLQVHHLAMEFTAPGSGAASILSKLRDDFEIGFGCVSVHPGVIDSAETIVARVEDALKYIAPERITLNPDCGFAPSSTAQVGLDEVYCKLKQEVAAAVTLRQMHHERLNQ